MSDYITGAQPVEVSEETLNYILRCLGGFASPIKSGAVTGAELDHPSTPGGLEGLSQSIYKGPVNLVVDGTTMVAKMTIPSQVSGTITEMVLIAGNIVTGESILVGRLPRSVNKKRGLSLDVSIRFTVSTN